VLQHHPQAASGAGGREAAIQAIMRRFPMSIGLLSDLERLDSRIAELIASGRLNAQHTAVRQLLAFILGCLNWTCHMKVLFRRCVWKDRENTRSASPRRIRLTIIKTMRNKHLPFQGQHFRHSEVDSDVSVRLPSLTSTSCDLDL